MNCSECNYDFDPTVGVGCPRCGEPFDCSAVSCEECELCGRALSVAGLRARLTESRPEEG